MAQTGVASLDQPAASRACHLAPLGGARRSRHGIRRYPGEGGLGSLGRLGLALWE